MTPWTRYGCEDGACIETTDNGFGGVAIRDSDQPDRVLEVPGVTWEAFLAAVRAPVEAERDEAVSKREAMADRLEGSRGDLMASAERLALKLAAAEDERDRWIAIVAKEQAVHLANLAKLVTADAQLAATAPVLDAARAEARRLRGLKEQWPGLAPTSRALVLNVEALDGVSPEGTARPPGATQTAPQAPDVAQGTDGLEAHRGAEKRFGERFWLWSGDIWIEVDKAEYVQCERAAGFNSTTGRPDEPATASFQNGQLRGTTLNPERAQGHQQPFVGEPDGIWAVTMTYTVNGEIRTETSRYDGDPYRGGKIIEGRDLLGGDNAIYLSSGSAIDTTVTVTDENTIRVTWGPDGE